MKVVVYAIAKNEEDHILEWYETMKEADEIYVLDTGSTDKTMELLKQCEKVKFKQKIIKPWRFDTARNESLNMVPEDADICVATDIDDRFEPGWRKALEKGWTKDATRASYIYALSTFKDGSPKRIMYNTKIHKRKDYHWIYPVHEVVVSDKPEKTVTIENMILKHCPKPYEIPSNYIDLLKFAVKEEPNEPRHVYMLAREYWTWGKYDKAIQKFHEYLKMNGYYEEVAAAKRHMARCYKRKGFDEEAVLWFKESIKTAPNRREPYYSLAKQYFEMERYSDAHKYFKEAEKITEMSQTFPNEEDSWDGTIYDYLSITSYREGKYKDALNYGKKALKFFPNDERIKDNLNLYITQYKKFKLEKELDS